MKLEEKQLTHKLMYQCFFMKLYEDEVVLPNDETSKRIYVEHDGAAAVLPITSDGKIILIKQFRYPVNQVLIEIPAGKKDDVNEEGYDCAVRELEEETGYGSNDIKKILDLHSCVGYSSEMIEIYIARNCKKMESPKTGDDDEFIELMILTKEEVKDLLKTGKITDAKTLVAIQQYLLEVI
ncbi:NUDIX hydrolase [Mycoplasmatota bacterium WC30]